MSSLSRPTWGDPGREKYTLGQLKDAQNLYDLTVAQEKQNQLLEEQNKLLRNNSTNYPYKVEPSNTSLLDLISIASMVPIFLGIILLFLIPGDPSAKPLGAKILTGGLLAPSLSLVEHTRKGYLITIFVIILVIFIALLMMT